MRAWPCLNRACAFRGVVCKTCKFPRFRALPQHSSLSQHTGCRSIMQIGSDCFSGMEQCRHATNPVGLDRFGSNRTFACPVRNRARRLKALAPRIRGSGRVFTGSDTGHLVSMNSRRVLRQTRRCFSQAILGDFALIPIDPFRTDQWITVTPSSQTDRARVLARLSAASNGARSAVFRDMHRRAKSATAWPWVSCLKSAAILSALPAGPRASAAIWPTGIHGGYRPSVIWLEIVMFVPP